MSDYLYNILARSFGLTETAQPLVTSLFEPPSDFKPVDALQTSAPTADPALASDAVDERAQPVFSANNQPDAPLVKNTEHAPPPAQTVHTHERVIIERLPQAAVENSVQASPPEKESQAKAETRIDEPAPDRPKNEPSAEQRPPSLSQRMNVAALDGLPQKAPESSPPVEINNVTHQRSETVIVQPQVSRAVETEQSDSRPQTRAAEPEQIVQVTIGRIEVRAAPPTPARQGTQQKSAAQPSQSLEEYLRQRAQGSANR